MRSIRWSEDDAKEALVILKEELDIVRRIEKLSKDLDYRMS